MSDCLISIIIPHYNSVPNIIELMDTIPSSDKIEVIVVDDRSTDNIEPLKTALAGRAVFLMNDREKKGAGTARNIGLDKAKGKWVIFADADDKFVGGWIDAVLDYVDSDYDEIFFSPTSFNIGKGQIGARHRHYEMLVKNHCKEKSHRTETELKYGFYTPWSKMIKKSTFDDNGIRFEEQMVANDVMAMNKCAFYSQCITADERVIYCVTCGDKTLTSAKNEKNFDLRIDTKIRRYLFLRDNLSAEEFRWTHSDYYMAGSIVDALMGKWGIKKTAEVIRKYHKDRIRMFSLGMLNPAFLKQYVIADIKWRKEVSKG